MNIIKATVHFNRRQFDKKYEIVAKVTGATGNPEVSEWIVLNVCDNHAEAIASVAKHRA